jgi:hypothetical protein
MTYASLSGAIVNVQKKEKQSLYWYMKKQAVLSLRISMV